MKVELTLEQKAAKISGRLRFLEKHPNYIKEYQTKNAKKIAEQKRESRKDPKVKAAYAARINAYRSRNPHISPMHDAVRRAVQRGTLIKRPCEICGATKAECHHESYDKADWLKVRWLCKKHHEALHHGDCAAF